MGNASTFEHSIQTDEYMSCLDEDDKKVISVQQIKQHQFKIKQQDPATGQPVSLRVSFKIKQSQEEDSLTFTKKDEQSNQQVVTFESDAILQTTTESEVAPEPSKPRTSSKSETTNTFSFFGFQTSAKQPKATPTPEVKQPSVPEPEVTSKGPILIQTEYLDEVNHDQAIQDEVDEFFLIERVPVAEKCTCTLLTKSTFSFNDKAKIQVTFADNAGIIPEKCDSSKLYVKVMQESTVQSVTTSPFQYRGNGSYEAEISGIFGFGIFNITIYLGQKQILGCPLAYEILFGGSQLSLGDFAHHLQWQIIQPLTYSWQNLLRYRLVSKAWDLVLRNGVSHVKLNELSISLDNSTYARLTILFRKLLYVDASHWYDPFRGVSKSDAAAFFRNTSDLRRLQYLNCSHTFVALGSEIAQMANRLKYIKSLVLVEIYLEDDACRFIGRMKSIEDLVIARTGLGPQNIDHFSGLHLLKYFDVAGTNVTIHNVMKTFTEHPYLSQINLFGTKVSEELSISAITDLHLFWPSLRRLVYDSKEYLWQNQSFIEAISVQLQSPQEVLLQRDDGSILNWQMAAIEPLNFEVTEELIVYQEDDLEGEDIDDKDVST